MMFVEKWMVKIAYGFNVAAGLCIIAMMLLTSADVFLRLFRSPITGTYEIIGFLGALFVSFALAHTSYQRGHIAVDFLVQKLPEKFQRGIMCANDMLGGLLFILISRQSVVYGKSLVQSGTVSMTLQMPVAPVVCGLAAGCGVLGLMLFVLSISQLFRKNPSR